MYNLWIEDFETDEIIKVKSPIVPVFRQSITYYNIYGELQSRVIRFVDYTFDKHGNLEYILLSVKDEINNSDTVE